MGALYWEMRQDCASTFSLRDMSRLGPPDDIFYWTKGKWVRRQVSRHGEGSKRSGNGQRGPDRQDMVAIIWVRGLPFVDRLDLLFHDILHAFFLLLVLFV